MAKGKLSSKTRILAALISGSAIIIAAVLYGGGDEASLRPGFSIDTLPSGIIEVRNGTDGIWGPGEAWVVREVFRLGSESQDSPELFSYIPDLELDPLGRVWLIEGQAQEVRVFDQLGGHVRTFGRRGQGPGEFSNVAALLWAPGGELWTIDQRLGRISVFDTTGVSWGTRCEPCSRT